MNELKPFMDALYLQGKLTAILGLNPDARPQEIERAVVELVRQRKDLP